MRCWNAGPACSRMSNPEAVSISICSGGRWILGPTHPMTAIASRQLHAGGARHSLANDCRTSGRTWSGVTIRDCNRPPRPMGGGPGGSTTVVPGSPETAPPMSPSYLYDQVEAAAARFRQVVDAASKLVSDLTGIELLNGPDGARFLSELVNRPGLPWDGSVGSGLNWSLAVSELDAERRFLRLDGEPVILYSLLSPPGAARANMLNDLYRLECPHDGIAGMAALHDRGGTEEDQLRAQALLLAALLHDGARSGNRRQRHRHGGQRGQRGVGSVVQSPGRDGNRWHCLWRHQLVHCAAWRACQHRAA